MRYVCRFLMQPNHTHFGVTGSPPTKENVVTCYSLCLNHLEDPWKEFSATQTLGSLNATITGRIGGAARGIDSWKAEYNNYTVMGVKCKAVCTATGGPTYVTAESFSPDPHAGVNEGFPNMRLPLYIGTCRICFRILMRKVLRMLLGSTTCVCLCT